MLPWLDEFGNPSSLHEEGRAARAAIDQAREALSGALGCLFAEALFTGSGTEAANMAILGVGLREARPRKFVFGAVEHHCVLACAGPLKRLGHEVQIAPVDREGMVDLDALDRLCVDAALVSVQQANNEVGTIQPVAQVAEIAARRGALLHCDAVQTFLNLPGWTVGDLGADLVTISSHKVGGPKGVGAIYIRAGVKLEPWIVGGGQEREMRAGTENVAGVAGFAGAIGACRPPVDPTPRNRFLSLLVEQGFEPTVTKRPTLARHAHGRFPGLDAETALIRLDQAGISASSGAACSSGSLEPSHVLLACGYSREQSREGLRFTFGPSTNADEAAKRVIDVIGAIRAAKR